MELRQPTPEEALEQAIAMHGGTELGRRLGISDAAVFRWRRLGRVPAGRVLAVERATGVSRHWQRPDIYPVEKREAAE